MRRLIISNGAAPFAGQQAPRGKRGGAKGSAAQAVRRERAKARKRPTEIAEEVHRNFEELGRVRNIRAGSLAAGDAGVFAATRQEKAVHDAEAVRRELAQDVYDYLPELEGAPYRGSRPAIWHSAEGGS